MQYEGASLTESLACDPAYKEGDHGFHMVHILQQ